MLRLRQYHMHPIVSTMLRPQYQGCGTLRWPASSTAATGAVHIYSRQDYLLAMTLSARPRPDPPSCFPSTLCSSTAAAPFESPLSKLACAQHTCSLCQRLHVDTPHVLSVRACMQTLFVSLKHSSLSQPAHNAFPPPPLTPTTTNTHSHTRQHSLLLSLSPNTPTPQRL